MTSVFIQRFFSLKEDNILDFFKPGLYMKLLFSMMLFFYINSLWGADINSTILNAQSSFYQNLLKDITSSKVLNNEKSLQQTLLNKLVLFSQKQNYKEISVNRPKNADEYVKLFDTYIAKLFLKEELQKDIVADKEKLQTLSEQIAAQKKAFLTTQLFYAFYTKKFQQESLQIKVILEELAKIEALLVNASKDIDFSVSKSAQNQIKLDKELLELQKEVEQLKIKKERYILLEQKKSLQWVDKEIVKTEHKEALLYRTKLNLLFLEFTQRVQMHAKNVMQLHQDILKLLKEHIENGEELESDLSDLLLKIERRVLGQVETLKAQGVQEFKIELKRVWVMANKPLFVINKTPISTLKLLLSLFIFIVGFFLGNIYKRYINALGVKNKTISASTHTLLANMGYYLIFLITFFIVLKVLGIDLSSIALVAGALSVGIGFGLQNTISNFVSGIILMVERSVKIGDYIELDENLRGHVVDIKMRSITVNTNSNIDIIVPNQELIQNRVINWTMNDKIRRFEIPFGVAYGTEPQKVISVILEAVQTSSFQDLYNTPERHTRVIMTGMGNSSVDFELFVWVKGKEILFPKRTTSRFLILIYNALYANNIEIPFPQQDIHIRSIDTKIPISS